MGWFYFSIGVCAGIIITLSLSMYLIEKTLCGATKEVRRARKTTITALHSLAPALNVKKRFPPLGAVISKLADATKYKESAGRIWEE